MRNAVAENHTKQCSLSETINSGVSASVLYPRWLIALKINVQFIPGFHTGITQHSSLTSNMVNMLIYKKGNQSF